MQVIGNLKNISMASSKLLLAAKSLSVDPAAGNAKNLLAAAARYHDPSDCSVCLTQVFSFTLHCGVTHVDLSAHPSACVRFFVPGL